MFNSLFIVDYFVSSKDLHFLFQPMVMVKANVVNFAHFLYFIQYLQQLFFRKDTYACFDCVIVITIKEVLTTTTYTLKFAWRGECRLVCSC